jgi:hypothetical protein
MDAENNAAPATAGDITKSYKSNARTDRNNAIRFSGHKLIKGRRDAREPATAGASRAVEELPARRIHGDFSRADFDLDDRHSLNLLAMCTRTSSDAGVLLVAMHAKHRQMKPESTFSAANFIGAAPALA